MIKTITIILTVLFSHVGFSQTYNSPESIEFDYANDRWLIANKNGNNILARNSSGVLSVFVPSVAGPHGIEIVDDTLYVCSGNSLKAYSLSTAALVFSINLGATFLNGITHDANYLYITDFSAKNIYRFDMATRAFTIFVTGLAKSPNGIIYDQPNNRCVFVNWGANAPIMAFDITTAATSVITATTLGNCDGIAKDGAGNYYISSWTLNGISKFNNTFTVGPTTVVTGLSSPADIFYNVLSDTLGNPNSGAANNTTYHYFGSTTAMNESTKTQFNFTVSPNPVFQTAEIKYELFYTANVNISLFDAKGKNIKTIVSGNRPQGSRVLIFNRDELAAGNYFLVFRSGGNLMTKQFVIAD